MQVAVLRMGETILASWRAFASFLTVFKKASFWAIYSKKLNGLFTVVFVLSIVIVLLLPSDIRLSNCGKNEYPLVELLNDALISWKILGSLKGNILRFIPIKVINIHVVQTPKRETSSFLPVMLSFVFLLAPTPRSCDFFDLSLFRKNNNTASTYHRRWRSWEKGLFEYTWTILW